MTARFSREYGAHLHVAAEARKSVRWDGNVSPDVPVRQPAERSMSERVASEVAGPLGSGSRTRSITHPVVPGKGRGPSSPLTPIPTLTDAIYERDVLRVVPSKYGNVKTDGYASKREAKRAAILRQLQACKVIANLREQVPYVLIPRQLNHDGTVAERACTYVADFVYDDLTSGETVVEDCKGVRTAEYIVKRKLMRFTYGIVVRET